MARCASRGAPAMAAAMAARPSAWAWRMTATTAGRIAARPDAAAAAAAAASAAARMAATSRIVAGRAMRPRQAGGPSGRRPGRRPGGRPAEAPGSEADLVKRTRRPFRHHRLAVLDGDDREVALRDPARGQAEGTVGAGEARALG